MRGRNQYPAVDVANLKPLSELDIESVLPTSLTETVYVHAEYPYDAYQYGHIGLNKTYERRYIKLLMADGTTFNTMFSRYYYSVYHKTVVPDHLEIDHRDEDRLNDRIWNLGPLTPSENIAKKNKYYASGLVQAIVLCPICGRACSKHPSNTFLVDSYRGDILFCSEVCSQASKSLFLADTTKQYIRDHQMPFLVKEYRNGEVYLDWINPNWVDDDGNIKEWHDPLISFDPQFSQQKLRVLNTIRGHLQRGLGNRKISQLMGVHRNNVKYYRQTYPWYFV